MSDATENFYMDVEYAGSAGRLFGLSLKTLALTVLTLGIYRFWMRTRMRRYYWSSVQPGGAPLEYTGTGLEKLLGFLIAVVFLAIYLGIVNLALTFVGISFLSDNEVMSALALNLSFLAVIPLIFYARYRARYYLLSRTTWRGLRFGADQAAWKYMLSALWHTFLSIITLGLLIPRQTFYLEKFVTDRTWYGDLKFEQQGKWTMLMRPWLLVIGVFLIIAAIGAVGASNDSPAMIVSAVIAGYVGIFVAIVYYSVVSFRLLAGQKVIGQNIRLQSNIRTGRVIGIYLLGFIGIFVAALLVLAALAAIGAALGFYAMNWDFSWIGFERQIANGGGGLGVILYVVFGYFAFLLILGALAQVFFVQPLLRHYAVELIIHNAEEIETASQRPVGKDSDAGGFADALDVGAAI